MQGDGGFSSGAWCYAPVVARGRRPVAGWAAVAADCTAAAVAAAVAAAAGCTVAAAAGCIVSAAAVAAAADRAEECSGECSVRRHPPDRRAEGLGWWAPRSLQSGERHTCVSTKFVR